MTHCRARAIKAIFAAGLLAFLSAAPAAAARSAEFQFSLAFNSSLPKGEFHDVLGKKVWGGSFGFGFRPSWSPVLIGMSMGLGIYGGDHWEDWLGLAETDFPVDVRSTNAIVALSLYLRLQPRRGILRPYLDVFAGVNIMTTDTRIGDGNGSDDDLNFNNASDAAFAWGAGAGVQLPILRFVAQEGDHFFSIDLDLGARYALGGRADYLVETGEHGTFDSRTSRTDLFTFSAGLAFIF